jgi:ribosomal protein L11 methyltransferase
MNPSPALVIRFHAGTTAPVRDRLLASLADFDLVAVQEDDLTAPSEWIAHFGSSDARDAAEAAVADESEFALIEVTRTEVEDEDWARRTQADLPAIRIGRIIVAPPWDLPKDVDPSVTTILIEPSRGFGTGHHQSTRLCLALLQAIGDLSGRSVIDVGTGSGVLAIAAAKLGAAFVNAIDNDPDAVENARENIGANNVSQIVEAHVSDLTTTTIPPAGLVTANLTGALLSRHAADLARLVQTDGSLIVSGFNIDEKPRVEEALAPFFTLNETAEEEGWWAFGMLKVEF